MLCDEATSALDPEATHEILSLLKSLNQQLGITIVLITHEIAVIRNICDEVIVMDNGEIVEQGHIESIFAKPKHSVTQSFISSLVNRKTPEVIKEQLVAKAHDSNFLLVLRLVFSNNIAKKPILSELIKKSDVDISIFAGYIDHIGNSTFGTLIVTLANDSKHIKQTKAYLISQGVEIETLGYIPRQENA